MPNSATAGAVNQLVDNLTHDSRKQFLAQCTREPLVFGEILCSPGESLKHVHFPLSGIIALVTPMTGHEPIELGMVGNEGMLGASLALGTDAVPICGMVLSSGTALRMTAAQFRVQLGRTPYLKRTLDAYLFVQTEQLVQAAACNSFHAVISRLACWLLMTHDRTHEDSICLTHQLLADMLGVRRSAVTIAAGELQRRKFIRYSRGRIWVISRKGVESAACGCYAATINAYNRRLPVSKARNRSKH